MGITEELLARLHVARTRITELETDMKRQAGSYLQAQAAWEKRESGIEADAERAWELVREAIRGRRSITDWLSRAEAALAARSGSH